MGLVNITMLKHHPMNDKIYGVDPEQDKELEESVKKYGVQENLIINKQYYIVAGNRRYDAARKAGIDKLPCEMRHFKSIDDEIEYLILSNQYRLKTNEEKIREGKKLAEIGIHRGDGRVRDQVGKRIGMSGKTFKKGEAVIDEIDRIAESDPERAKLLRGKLNHSVSAAAKSVEDGTTPEDDDSENNDDSEEQLIDETAYALELKKAEDKRTLFYVQELKEVIRTMNGGYKRLATRRTSVTPRAVGNMIGNIKDMVARLESWLPENMIACENCQGTGRVKIADTDKETTCDVCISGRTGYYKPSEN
jgi:ParB-like chromosome segregation protein Spo0J